MKRVVVLALVLWLAGCAGNRAQVSVHTPVDAARAANAFGLALYQAAKGPDSCIQSPLSAAVALSMTLAGARGETQAEMARVLRVDPAQLADTAAAYARLTGDLNARDGQKGLALRIANRLWGRAGTTFKPTFLALMREAYQAPLETIDVGNPKRSAAVINGWAARATRDRIQDLLTEDNITPDLALILTNAIYFKARWREPFEVHATQPRPFHAPGGDVSVPTMAGVFELRHAQVGPVAVIELPYQGGLSMVVALPDTGTPLERIEAELSQRYPAWVAALGAKPVDVRLPRWTTRTSGSLSAPLQRMGMQLSFDSTRADFSGMTDGAPLYISNVIQQAFIEVTEQGTEAAAATAVFMGEESGTFYELPPTPFHADRPFVYFLRDPDTGAILFIGRVTRP